jgi:hypothetical protein
VNLWTRSGKVKNDGQQGVSPKTGGKKLQGFFSRMIAPMITGRSALFSEQLPHFQKLNISHTNFLGEGFECFP